MAGHPYVYQLAHLIKPFTVCVCVFVRARACVCLRACVHVCLRAFHSPGVNLYLTDRVQVQPRELLHAPTVDRRPDRPAMTHLIKCEIHSSSQFEFMQAAGKIACLHAQLDCELSAQATSRPQTPGIATCSLSE